MTERVAAARAARETAAAAEVAEQRAARAPESRRALAEAGARGARAAANIAARHLAALGVPALNLRHLAAADGSSVFAQWADPADYSEDAESWTEHAVIVETRPDGVRVTLYQGIPCDLDSSGDAAAALSITLPAEVWALLVEQVQP